jgi:hypothetical protein
MTPYEQELVSTVGESPKFRVILKEQSWFMKVLSWLLFFNRDFMTSFVTTIGDYMWTPAAWENDWDDKVKAAILRHERVHLRQQKRYGMTLYILRYLCWPLPMFLAYGRYLLEREAYEESLQAYADYHGVDVLMDANLRAGMIRHFTSAEYGWMWPFPKAVARWYDQAIERVRGHSKRP